MTREERLRAVFDAYARGDVAGLNGLFAPDAQWLGIPGIGIDGATPI